MSRSFLTIPTRAAGTPAFWRSWFVACFCLLTVTLSTLPCFGQGQPSQEELTAENRKAIVDSVSMALQEFYVFPEVAKDISDSLSHKLSSGQYDEITKLADFTRQLTADLGALTNDSHLRVRPYSAPDESEVGDSAALLEQQMAGWREENFGFREIDRLDGNIGYLDLSGFYDIAYAAPTAIAAMNFLANSEALIIDLRTNTGGNGNMSRFLCSYFFSEPQKLETFYNRAGDIERESWTEEYVPGPRLTNIPIYILVSGATHSAAEGFAYALKHLGRAKVVGDTTRGGAHPMESHEFPELSISVNVPFLRPVNPTTKSNWEGVGVIPDIAASGDDALEVALIDALKTMMADAASDEDRHGFSMLIEEAQARLNPVVLSEEELGAYIGSYGGMQVMVKAGRLNVVGYILIPMGNDKFMVTNGNEQVKFVRDDAGDIAKMVVLFRNGSEVPFNRTGG